MKSKKTTKRSVSNKDSRSIRGDSIHRDHEEPRLKLCDQLEEIFPDPVEIRRRDEANKLMQTQALCIQRILRLVWARAQCMSARWPLAQGGRVGRAGETSVSCPPTQPCRKLVVFVFWGRCGEPHLLSGAEARRSSPVERKRNKNSTARARGHKRANTQSCEQNKSRR